MPHDRETFREKRTAFQTCVDLDPNAERGVLAFEECSVVVADPFCLYVAGVGESVGRKREKEGKKRAEGQRGTVQQVSIFTFSVRSLANQ